MVVTPVTVVITPLSSMTGLWACLAGIVHALPYSSIPGNVKLKILAVPLRSWEQLRSVVDAQALLWYSKFKLL